VCALITSGIVGIPSRNFFRPRAARGEGGVIIWVQFLEGPPPKIWEGQKDVHISARFLTTFDFYREYLRNRSSYRASERNLINYNPLHVGRKKLGELWSTNEEVLGAHIHPPEVRFQCKLAQFLRDYKIRPLLRDEFRPKLTFHSDLRRRAASRLALPCTSSLLLDSPWHGIWQVWPNYII